MKLTDFDYNLPEELIAQTPLLDRSSSRLLVLNRQTGEVEHTNFKNIFSYLRDGDCLVFNDTKVIPARLFGKKKGTGGAISFVLLRKYDDDVWEVILKPGKRAKVGTVFVFGDNDKLEAEILEIKEGGNRLVKFSYEGIFEEVLDEIGVMPVPPYIHEELKDKDRYQTVYAKTTGSAAAPTAGLHFTEEILSELEKRNISVAFVTLHIGLGTFRPVKVDNIEEHLMHSEYFEIEQDACDKINSAKRVISVGTTSTRVMESIADENGKVGPFKGDTDIFIYPGYEFSVIDGMITNFHLPKSTLIMLISALAGRENVLEAYRQAVEEEYRFFSFGDAMLII